MKYNREKVREKYKDLFEFSLDLIYVNDMRGNFLDANDIALEKLGFNRDEIPDISFIVPLYFQILIALSYFRINFVYFITKLCFSVDGKPPFADLC